MPTAVVTDGLHHHTHGYRSRGDFGMATGAKAKSVQEAKRKRELRL